MMAETNRGTVQAGKIKTTVIIPNYNGGRYLRNCLQSLFACEQAHFPVIVVDNGSADGSRELVRDEFPQVKLICFTENRGFSAAVNAGIRASETPFVILLNNDTVAEKHFVSCLTKVLAHDSRCFSVGARMVTMSDPHIIDDAGDYYCALGWAFARGKGRRRECYERPCEIFAACGGAAAYRRDILEELGMFDENYFAYLEDIDIAFRARLAGYRNRYEPGAVVRHAGTDTSGSRYNEFKIRLSSRNNIYLLRKNLPLLLICFNLPFLLVGFAVKYFFFLKKGYGKIYLAGLAEGMRMTAGKRENVRGYASCVPSVPAWIRLEGELLFNLFVRLFFS